MPFTDAVKAIDNELGSHAHFRGRPAGLLNNFKLALSLANGDVISSSTTWNNLNKKNLPITLRLAGMLAFKEDFKNVLPDNPSEAYRLYPRVVRPVRRCRDGRPPENRRRPFWTTAQPSQLRQLAKNQYPLDRLLLLAYWQQYFADNPSRTWPSGPRSCSTTPRSAFQA